MLATRIFCILAILYSISVKLKGQNLVPNFSFDTVASCPFAGGQLRNARPWLPSNRLSSDIVHRCGSTLATVPENYWGTQEPASGDGYAGIRTYLQGTTDSEKDYREYLFVELRDSLIAGSIYVLSFKVSPAEVSRYVSDDIGMYLSREPIPENRVLDVSPQLSNPEGSYITNFKTWKTLETEYTALGGEKYLVIGNFKYDRDTDRVGRVDDLGIESTVYYFIDDVIVQECTSNIPDELFSATDTILCDGDTINLYVDYGVTEFKWQNGSSSRRFTVTEPGLYEIEAKIEGCTAKQNIEIINPLSNILNYTNDTILCAGDSIVLKVTNTDAQWEWEDGANAATRNINTPGAYILTAMDQGCIKSDTINIDFDTRSSSDVLIDTIICSSYETILGPRLQNVSFLWDNGSIDSIRIINSPGIYEVSLTSTCVQNTYTYNTSIEDCACHIEFPEVVSPNQDGINDIARFSTDLSIQGLRYRIFDRWGTQVFSGKEREFWDGRNNGQDLPENVYYFILEYKCPAVRSGAVTQSGAIMLLR